MRLSQKDLVNIKDLENDVLKLGDKLKPLSTSYTQTSSEKGKEEGGEDKPKEGDDGDAVPVKTDIDEGGRPAKKQEEKAETTIAKEKSLDATGGS